jgi:hypothetical protein
MPSSLFALEVFIPIVPGNALRANLHQTIALSPHAVTYAQKRQFYQGLTQLLIPAAPWFVRGNWDYTNEHAEAEAEYDQWCHGTVRDARERPLPIPGVQPADQRYMFATLAFLLDRGGTCDQILEQATTLPPDRLWLKQTFAALLGIIPRMNFVSVKGDAAYLCPGVDEHGISETEIRTEKYAYLHVLR